MITIMLAFWGYCWSTCLLENNFK